MDYLSKEKSVLLVGLNPTEQAKKHGAVFCQTNGIWRVIEKSELFKFTGLVSTADIPIADEKDGRYKFYADNFFGPKSKVGYVDLVTDVFEKKGNKVKVNQRYIDKFYSKLNTLNVDKIGLLGKQVTRALFPELKGKKFEYGEIPQSIKVGGRDVKVFCLPFPETVPMKVEDKAGFYSF
ncbi:MAG: hypothetical protein EBX50_07720 [Chitinophagia bacterium]|nr:hypothetical protein [Chitinophagia bacterium]